MVEGDKCFGAKASREEDAGDGGPQGTLGCDLREEGKPRRHQGRHDPGRGNGGT